MPRRPSPPAADARHRFTARVLASLEELASRLDGRRLAAVAAEPGSGYGLLLSALEQPEAQEALRREDPLAPARLRGIRMREELLHSEGGVVGAPEMAALLGITRQAVDKRRKAGKLLAVAAGARRWLYPSWQVAEGGSLAGLEQALAALREWSPWARLGFLLGENVRLGGERPLDALRRGDVDRVLRAARAFGDQGAA
jgi:hypothetical protein